MPSDRSGSTLRRGGTELEVEPAPRAFTARLAGPADVDRLRTEHGDDIRDITLLTSRVARVEARDERSRDGLVDAVRRGGRAVQHEYVAGDDRPPVHLTDEVIVRFHDDVDDEAAGRVLADAGAVVRRRYPHLAHTYLVQAPAAAVLGAADALHRSDAVAFAEPALINRFLPQAVPDVEPRDELFAEEWHLHSRGGPALVKGADARVSEAWQLSKGSRSVVVAVLDDGFDLTHPDLRGHGKIVDPVDFTDGDLRPMPGGRDFHGTCCAGVAIAEENGRGCVGAAPRCAFMPVRFPWSIPDPHLIEVFRYVSSRAHVAACSWSTPPGEFPLHSAVAATLDELARTGGPDGRGLIVCVAAGNFGAPVVGEAAEPIRWGEHHDGATVEHSARGPMLNGLAAHEAVIAVGACTSLGRPATYSNYGAELAVAAPSDDRDPVTLERLEGRGITTSDNERYGRGFTPGKRFTSSFGGTSSAAALVAGVCALMKSVNPSLGAQAAKQILSETAEALDGDGGERAFPGRVNAARAVRQAAEADLGDGAAPPWPGYDDQDAAEPLDVLSECLRGAASDVIDLARAVLTYEERGERRDEVLRAAHGLLDLVGPWEVPGAAPTTGLGPAGWVPGGWVPGGWVPGGWVPGGWVPGGWVPGGWVPGGWVPGGWVPGDQPPD